MTNVAQQYGQALYDLAMEEGISKTVLAQMQVLSQSFAETPDFLRLLASVNLSREERCGLLDDSFCNILHPYLLNFLKILTQEGIVRKFPDCCRHFESCYYTDNDILPVVAYTAQLLTAEQSKQLHAKMESITGKKVILQNRIDPDCLGGVRLCYDGKQVDGTVKDRMEAVGKLLKNTVL